MTETNDRNSENMETQFELGHLPGIIALLGELKPGAIITAEGMAQLFKRHAASVKRAVQRGELPAPYRLFGSDTWNAGAIVQHFEHRQEEAAKDAERMARKLAKLSL